MTVHDALNLLDRVVADAAGTRRDHQTLKDAVALIRGVLPADDTPAGEAKPPKADKKAKATDGR